MLNTPITEEFNRVIELIIFVFENLDFGNAELQKNLAQTIPKKWNPPFTGILNYLLKGLCSKTTEKLCIRLLTKLTCCSCSFLLHEDKHIRLLANVLGLLPYILSEMGRGDSIAIAASLSEGFFIAGQKDLSAIFHDYRKYVNSVEGIRRFLHEVASLLSKEYFPKYELYVFQVLFELLEHNATRKEHAILLLMEALISETNPQSSELFNEQNVAMFYSLAKYFGDPLLRGHSRRIFENIGANANFSMPCSWAMNAKSVIERPQYSLNLWCQSTDHTSLLTALYEAFSPTLSDSSEVISKSVPPPIEPHPLGSKPPRIQSSIYSQQSIADYISTLENENNNNNNNNEEDNTTSNNVIIQSPTPENFTAAIPQKSTKYNSFIPKSSQSNSKVKISLGASRSPSVSRNIPQ